MDDIDCNQVLDPIRKQRRSTCRNQDLVVLLVFLEFIAEHIMYSGRGRYTLNSSYSTYTYI